MLQMLVLHCPIQTPAKGVTRHLQTGEQGFPNCVFYQPD